MYHRCFRVRTTRFLTFAMCLTVSMMLLTSGIAAQDDQLTATAATATTELAPEATAELTPADVVPTETMAAEVTATQATPELTVQPSPSVTATPADRIVYIVQRGDTLARIAARFGTTVSVLAAENNIVNVDLIFVGQRLLVPGQTSTPTASVTPVSTATAPATATVVGTAASTLVPTATIEAGRTYVVQAGDTLAKIAVRFNVTLAQLLALNTFDNPNIILPGQTIVLPASATEPSVTATPPPPPTPIQLPTTSPLESGFDYGVSAFYVDQDAASVANSVSNLGVSWVRLTVNWRGIEAVQGQPDFSALDEAVQAIDASGLNILLTVTNSPDWARSVSEEQGPPDDFNDYARFMETLAGRYAGVVDAYQVWYEPNLRREWYSDVHQIGADSYIALLHGAYAAVKRADAAALVIAAGLAPTGYHDGVNAINDRIFLADLYAANVMSVSDAIAAHPGGWANPPDATCCAAPEGVLTHYQDRSFFFKDTLDDYRAVMIQNRDDRPLWVTKFGWGSSADTTPPGEGSGYIYVTYTDLNEQAAYTVRAFEMGKELGFVGPMFLDNLNGCQTSPLRVESCYTSLSGSTELRPVYAAVQTIDKSIQVLQPIAPGSSDLIITTPIPFDQLTQTPFGPPSPEPGEDAGE